MKNAHTSHAKTEADKRFNEHRFHRLIAIAAISACAGIANSCGSYAEGDSPADTASHQSTADESDTDNDLQTLHDALVAQRPFHAGYMRRNFEFAGLDGELVTRQLDLWYPTSEPESEFLYLYQRGQVAVDADVAEGKHPLILFSHGFMGSSDQSIYIMEALARAGFIVAAVNHNDALFNQRDQRLVPPRSFELDEWNDTSYADRRHDIVTLLEELLAWNEKSGHAFEGRMDTETIAAMGHSLGGYTVMGLVGAWPTWRDERIKVAVLYSPFVHPFRENGDLSNIKIPVMMQGATLDLGISQYLLSIYRRLDCPRHYVILEGGTHLEWTNFVSVRTTTIECLDEENPELIVNYTIAFLDHFLLGQDRSELLESDNPRLHDWAAHLDSQQD